MTTRQQFANLIDINVSAYPLKDVEDLLPADVAFDFQMGWRAIFDAEMTFIAFVPAHLASSIASSINAGGPVLPSDGTEAA